MDFIFKFDKVNIIQFFIILMIVFPGNGLPSYIIRKTGSFYDCVLFGSHQTEIFWENSEHLPWKVRIGDSSQTVQKVICDGILISNKHVLAAASCILRGQDPVDLQANTSSLQHNRVELPTGKFADISKLYVHKNYSNSTHDFNISILELKEMIIELKPSYIYPTILPRAPLAFHHGNQLHVAMTKGLSENHFERVNASIWSKDECAPNAEHLMCIETDSNCENLMHPSTEENISPIFYISNGNREILGLPMGCKRIDSPMSKSALVYLRVADFLPWIENIIFNGGSKCVIKTANFLNAVIFLGFESGHFIQGVYHDGNE